MSQDQKQAPQTDAMGFPQHLSLLDSVIHVLAGPPDSMLTPKELAEKHSKQNEAYGMAQSAMKSPGAEFMGAPSGSLMSAGGGSGGIMNLIKGLFGGGAG